MKERNFLPWAMAIQPLAAIHELLESYAGILEKLKMHESPENTKASKGPRSVPDCYKAWVTKLIKPYFTENGFNNKENDTEVQRELRDKMKEFACEDLKYEECLSKNGHILPTGQWYAPSAVIKHAWYCMVLHGVAWYCMVLHCIACYCMVLHGVTWYCMVLLGIAWYCMVLHGIA